MQTTVVTYTVRPEAVEENCRLIAGVYAELASTQPAGFRYATFALDDGASFLHIAHLDEGAAHPLPSSAAFQEFQRDIASRVVAPPNAQQPRMVGSYGL